ncbi:GNAT family N-acetyltransferase [Verrucomicrobiota bacterium]
MSTSIVRDGPVEPEEIDGLREAVGWERSDGDYTEVLAKACTYYTVRDQHGHLVAYMSVLSDGVADAFLLDLAVHPTHQHKGIGTRIVRRAISDMQTVGVQCVHVTFAPHLEPFYAQCGLHIIKAGIVDFKNMKWNEECQEPPEHEK